MTHGSGSICLWIWTVRPSGSHEPVDGATLGLKNARRRFGSTLRINNSWRVSPIDVSVQISRGDIRDPVVSMRATQRGQSE